MAFKILEEKPTYSRKETFTFSVPYHRIKPFYPDSGQFVKCPDLIITIEIVNKQYKAYSIETAVNSEARIPTRVELEILKEIHDFVLAYETNSSKPL